MLTFDELVEVEGDQEDEDRVGPVFRPAMDDGAEWRERDNHQREVVS